MHSCRASRCDPNLLNSVTWAVLNGCRLFHRVQVEPHVGLRATERIQAYDFVSLTPVEATQSLFSVAEDSHHFPLLTSPQNYGEPLPFFTPNEAPDLANMNRGSFSFICYMAVALFTSQPQGLHSYLRVLPASDWVTSPATLAAKRFFSSSSQNNNVAAFRDYVTPVLSHAKISSSEEFERAFCHAFGLFRRHAVPLWSPSMRSSPNKSCMRYFEASPFTRHDRSDPLPKLNRETESKWSGEIVGLVPFSDFAAHSREPNAAIGFPDEESLMWIQQEKRMKKLPQNGCVALQALRDIEPGDIITVDKNAFFNFDSSTFEWWFGFPYEAKPLSSRADQHFNPLHAGSNSVPSSSICGETTVTHESDSDFFVEGERAKTVSRYPSMEAKEENDSQTMSFRFCSGGGSTSSEEIHSHSGLSGNTRPGHVVGVGGFANDPRNPYSSSSFLDPTFCELLT